MDATGRMPDRANLCGIGYRIAESEGLIVFTEEEPIWGNRTRISFDRRSGCWYVSISDATDSVMVGHVVKAWDIVRRAYGGDHEFRDGEHRP